MYTHHDELERVETTFWMDFSIAERFGNVAIKDTYDRAVKEWGNDIRYIAELYVVLNHKCWFWFGKGNEELARLYDQLFYTLRDFVYEDGRFNRDELSFFFDVTD